MTIRRTWVAVAAWGTILVLLAPVLHTAHVSFSPDSFLTPPTVDWSLRWYRAFLADPRWTAAAGRSLAVAGLSALLAVAVATPAALASARAGRRAPRTLRAALLLPALVPPAALGTGLLPLMHRAGLRGTLTGLVLVHAALGLPVAFLVVRNQAGDALRELEAAAAGLGATARQVLLRITLPLLRPALAAAACAVFVLSLNESFVTLFLATPDNETLPAVVWPQLRFSPTPAVAVASCATSLAGTLALLAAWRLLGPREPTRPTK